MRAEQIDATEERLSRWLDHNLPALGDGPLRLTRLSGGSSNAVFKLTRDGKAAVLRQAPAGGDRLIEREARLLTALGPTAVPCARMLALCADAGILGTKFLVLELVEGRSGAELLEPGCQLAAEEARELSYALIDAAAELARLDYVRLGLADFGKPDGFLARQVDRWLAMMTAYRNEPDHRERDIPGFAFVSGWLKREIPATSSAAILHGDIGFPNSIFTRTRPAHVAALLDWETATIGDPLLDLARAVLPMPGAGCANFPTSLHDYSQFPSREELAERYAERTGNSVARLDYYVVLAHFKLAVILERHHSRAENGLDPTGEGRRLADYAIELIARAEAVARGLA